MSKQLKQDTRLSYSKAEQIREVLHEALRGKVYNPFETSIRLSNTITNIVDKEA